PHQRRDRAAAVYGPQQSVLEHEPARAHGEPAGGHFSVRAQPVQELATAGLIRRAVGDAGDPDPQYLGARPGIGPQPRRQPALMNAVRSERGAPVEARPPKFEVKHLDFYYGQARALKDINLSLADRSITAFIGPSGCGKSTLLRVFNRMYALYPGHRATG